MNPLTLGAKRVDADQGGHYCHCGADQVSVQRVEAAVQFPHLAPQFAHVLVEAGDAAVDLFV